MKTDSIDAWAKGEKRIPPGVWREVRALLQDRFLLVPQLMAAVDRLDET